MICRRLKSFEVVHRVRVVRVYSYMRVCIRVCEHLYMSICICTKFEKNILVGNISNAPAIHFHVEPYTHELNKIAMLLFSHCINIEPPYQLRLLHGSKRIMILFLYEPAHAC